MAEIVIQLKKFYEWLALQKKVGVKLTMTLDPDEYGVYGLVFGVTNSKLIGNTDFAAYTRDLKYMRQSFRPGLDALLDEWRLPYTIERNN